MSTPILELRGLTRRFGAFEALRGVDLQLDGVGVHGFLGVNGAGKTTTLRIVAGLLKPSGGEARLFGQDASVPEVRARIGYLPQEPHFFGWMSGEELLVYVGELFGLARRDATRRASELLARLGLEQAARRRVGTYSGGMRQRLGIAQALLNQPDLLLLDEPVSALDPLGRAEMLDLLEELGRTSAVFFSSHVLGDVERVCDDVTILDRGRVLLRENTRALRQRFVLSALDLTLDHHDAQTLAALRSEPWVREVQVHGEESENPGSLRLAVLDLEQAGRALPSFAAAHGLGIRQLTPVQPSLEQIFVQLVDQDGGRRVE
ncbi:MAG: ABC transporter ATP-binding protein [Pseudomonadota bacterium]